TLPRSHAPTLPRTRRVELSGTRWEVRVGGTHAMGDSAPDPPGPLEPAGEEVPEVSPEEFVESFGEELQRTLDVDTWSAGEDLAVVYGRLAEEVRAALAQEEGVLGRIREQIFPQLAGYPGAPEGAGVRAASMEALERIHRGLLF